MSVVRSTGSENTDKVISPASLVMLAGAVPVVVGAVAPVRGLPGCVGWGTGCAPGWVGTFPGWGTALGCASAVRGMPLTATIIAAENQRQEAVVDCGG